MAKLSKNTVNIISGYVRKDLKPGLFYVFWRLCASIAVGGVLSLFICGQFGIAFNTTAIGWNHLIHAHLGATQCAIVCGAAFSVLPVLILRFISSGVFFRVIIRRFGLAQAGAFLFAGILMYFGGTFMNEIAYVGIWFISALLSFKLCGLILDEVTQLIGSASAA